MTLACCWGHLFCISGVYSRHSYVGTMMFFLSFVIEINDKINNYDKEICLAFNIT